MATFTAVRGSSTFPVAGNGLAAGVQMATGTIELAANVADGDIYEFCRVPKDAVVFMGWVTGDDLDTGTEALDMDCGWAANGTDSASVAGLGNFGIISGDAVPGIKPEVSIFLPLGGVLRTAGPKKFSAETLIQMEGNAAAGTGGTGTLTVTVLYFIDPSFTV